MSCDVLNQGKLSNYILQFNNDKIPNMEFYVKSFNLPAYNVTENNITFAGVNTKQIGGIITFESNSLEIICDEKFQARENIDKIMFSIKNPETGIAEYISEKFDVVNLYILTNKLNVVKKIEFKSCWFNNISSINFDTTNPDAPIATFSINLNSEYYQWKDV